MRFLCHHCDWGWKIHRWLPFDFPFARWAFQRHVLKGHGIEHIYDKRLGDWIWRPVP